MAGTNYYECIYITTNKFICGTKGCVSLAPLWQCLFPFAEHYQLKGNEAKNVRLQLRIQKLHDT